VDLGKKVLKGLGVVVNHKVQIHLLIEPFNGFAQIETSYCNRTEMMWSGVYRYRAGKTTPSRGNHNDSSAV